MKRLVLAASAVVVGVVVSSCAVGVGQPATDITDTSAVLNGKVLSTTGGPGSWYIEYGPTTARTERTPTRTIDFVANEIEPVSEAVDGLEPATTYHFAVCAEDGENQGEPFCSPDRTFLTGGGTQSIAFTSNRNENGDLEIWVMDADGSNQTRLTNHPGLDHWASWSPDGGQIAFETQPDGTTSEVYVMDADGGNRTRLTNNHPTEDTRPAWSPQGDKIAFTSNRDGNPEIYVMDADGGNPTRLTNSPGLDTEATWSPDGSKIAFTSNRGETIEIWVMDADGGNPTKLTNNPASDFTPAWSPQGDKIAFTSSRDLSFDVIVMNANGSNQINVTNNPADDLRPAWSPDGSKIAFETNRDHYPGNNPEIYAMNADGSNPTNITNTPGFSEETPAWGLRP